jgi:hypothetical protein
MSSLSKPNAALAPIRESLSNENLRLLFTGRALRSFSLGYLNVIIAASLQAVNAALYYAFFRNVRPPEEL